MRDDGSYMGMNRSLLFQILLQPIFYGTVTPLLLYFTAKKLIIDPYNARKKRREREEEIESNRAK